MSNEKKNEVAMLNMLKKDIVGSVEEKLNKMVTEGGLHMPENYSSANSLNSAWLILQGITAKSGNDYLPVLKVCSKDSIANSLLDMVTQGLNPAKKQCYFIAYGKSLNLQRSYFGDLAVMKRLNNVKSVNANVVYEKDEFSINIELDGSKSIDHKTSFESLGSPIKGAYCIINFQDGTRHIEVMSKQQIEKSWDQSKNNWKAPNKKGEYGPHINFAEEMAKRTVIRKACKMYINTSDDNDLLIESFNRTTASEYKNVEHEVEKEIEDNANSEVIDIEPLQNEEVIEETEASYEADTNEDDSEFTDEVPY